ncbi:hypothetical protein ABIE33_004133 [Ensifer sp. 4252]
MTDRNRYCRLILEGRRLQAAEVFRLGNNLDLGDRAIVSGLKRYRPEWFALAPAFRSVAVARWSGR